MIATKPAVPAGVPASAWERIAKREGDVWMIAERDATGEVVGVAVRDANGGKTCKPGGKRGLILAWPLDTYAGTSADDPVFVCEGASDTGALLGLGLDAVGVPMAGHCGDWLAELLADRHAGIVADADDPGRSGAVKLVAELLPRCKSVRVIEPPEGAKDARAAVIAGAIRADFLALVERAEPEVIESEPQSPVLAWRSFPIGALPEPIRAFVEDSAKAIGCDPSYVALPLLSALAAAIGNTHRIALKRRWTEPAIVWTAIVGESGTAKSPALELALRPIRKRQHDAMREHADAMKQYADRLAMHERDAAQWKRSKSDTPPPTKPEAPIADRCWTDDVTTEALAALLQQNPRGLLMVRDELAAWFAFDAYKASKGGDVAKWLEMFGGRPMVVDRKSGGTLYVPRAAVSIAGGIQPETLRRALGQEHRDNGLAARLLFAMPPRSPKRWTEADVSEATEAAVAAVFDRLFVLTPETDDDGDERPRLLTLADDGKRAWVAFYNEHAIEQAELSGDEAAAWSKLEGYAARLALVVHLTRYAAGDPTLGDVGRVDAASVDAGVVLARWFGDEARRVYAILSESDDERKTRRLLELVQRKGGDVSGRELVQSSRAFRRVPDAEAALSKLVEAGVGSWVKPEQRGRGGPKARRFVLSPVYGVNVYRNPAGDTEKANPVDVDGVDTPPDSGIGWGEL